MHQVLELLDQVQEYQSDKMKYRYATTEIGENSAKAVGKDLSISTKIAIEICNVLRHKKVERAKQILEAVLEKKMAIPMRIRFPDQLPLFISLINFPHPFKEKCDNNHHHD